MAYPLPPQKITPQLAQRAAWLGSFPLFAEQNLWIRGKLAEPVKPFRLKPAQRTLHKRLEEQRRERGYVRAIILKGRQMGISTYIAGRFYHRVTHNQNMRCFVMAHERTASQNLFNFAKTFLENDAREGINTSADSATELLFEGLNSGYKVATAGSKDTGRGQTVQLCHFSEVAFWQFAESHVNGIMQTIFQGDGTEVLLESTANGPSGFFYETWQEAEANPSMGYAPIFLPWFDDPDYQMRVPKDYEFSPEDLEYSKQFSLTREQLYWRRAKIIELKSDESFKQEYPSIPSEAFTTTGGGAFIDAKIVLAARKRRLAQTFGETIGGVDFGHHRDNTVLAVRRGRKVIAIDECPHTGQGSTMAAISWLTERCRRYGIRKLYADATGLGGPIVERMEELPIGRIVEGIRFLSGGDAINNDAYMNRRAELWGVMRDWLGGEVEIPDNDRLHADMTTVRQVGRSDGKMQLESKKDLAARNVRSPDYADAVALTFGGGFAESIDFLGDLPDGDRYEPIITINAPETPVSSITGY